MLSSKGINNPLVAFFLKPVLSLSAKVVLFKEDTDKRVKLLGLPQLAFFPIGGFLTLGKHSARCFFFGHVE
jgi:hypothetical protein